MKPAGGTERDLLIERVTSGGVETSYPATLQYVFATIPALAYYSDTAPGPHSAAVTYPLPYGQPGTLSSPVGPGNGFPVAAGQDGNVVVHLRLWRPQRRRIEGEPGMGEWTDIGGLTYIVQAFSQRAGPPGADCPQDSLSQPGGGLRPPPSPEQVPGRNQQGELIGGLSDTAPDQPADRGNLLSFTVNVSRCLATRGINWQAGETITLNISAIAGDGRDRTEQAFGLKLVR